MYRTLVLGIDAATLDLIEPYAAAGYLPHIHALMQQGSYAALRSTIPAMSPPAWTSMITGQNPGNHGIYDFIRFMPGTYRLQATRSDQTSYRTIFDLASHHGRKVLAVNVPLTYPPRPVNGTMVAGPIVPQRGIFTHPPELSQQLRARNYRVDPEIRYVPGEDGRYRDDVLAAGRTQVEVMLELMQQRPWDLAMIVLRAVDEGISYLWHHLDPTHPRHDPLAAQAFGTAIQDIHTAVDRWVGQLIAAAGPDTVIMLVSDHGAGPCYKEVFLNVWLEQQGWLVRRHQPLNSARKRLQRRLGITREHLAPKLDWPMAWKLRKLIPLTIQHSLFPEQTVTLSDTVDWTRTRAYSIGNIGQIYINLKGREAQGIVRAGQERARLLDDITHALGQLTDEGTPVVDQVVRSEDLYHGPYANDGPDLNILMRGMTYVSQSWREMAGHEVFSVSTTYTGTHRPLGVVMLAGHPIANAGKLSEVRIEDIAPTLLWLLDVPIPDDLDGRLLRPMLRPDALASTPPQHSTLERMTPLPSVSPGWADEEEEQEVLDRLRDLGYLE